MSTTSSVPMESKSAKKRKAKAEAQAQAAPTSTGEQTPPVDNAVNGTSGHDNVNGTENSYLKELSKNIRNLHKKLAGTAKADSVVEQNPGISIDDLVVQKKLNADQKAQLLKKPALQAQLAQYEEQHKHFQTFAQGLEDKHSKDKAAMVESHEEALAKARKETEEAQAAKTSQSGQMEHGLKVITGFLHAAAAMRQNQDQESDEARAFEGALLLVYQGNASSLETLKSLVEGSDEKVPDVEGNALDYTFSQIKEAALKDVAALLEDAGTVEVEAPTVDTAEETTVDTTVETGTDPTIAHAGLTELEDTTAIIAQTNGDATPEAIVAPEQASVTADAANATAEANWDPQASITSTQTATGEDWVQVPRDPAETETGNSQPAVQQSTSNWADEAGAAAASEEKIAPENDGFEQVRRDRGGRGRGGPRGRGGRGGGDGRGRGRGRGHGRGGPRGGGRGAGSDKPSQES